MNLANSKVIEDIINSVEEVYLQGNVYKYNPILDTEITISIKDFKFLMDFYLGGVPGGTSNELSLLPNGDMVSINKPLQQDERPEQS